MLLVVGLMAVSSCKKEQAKPVKTEKKTTQKLADNKKSKAKKGNQKLSQLGLTSAQTESVKKINAAYKKKIDTLKKDKKWAGNANKKVRESLNAAKQKELKSALGDKYAAYQKMMTAAKKKTPSKKISIGNN